MLERHDPADLKARCDLQRFMQAHNEPLKGRIGSKTVFTSWRDEKQPSVAVYHDGYKDFGSGDGGDVFTYCQQRLNLPFVEALEYVAAWIGDLPTQHVKTALKNSKNSAVSEPPNASAQANARQVIEAGKAALWSDEGKAALADLHTAHGLTDDTIRAARLGYASADTMRRLFPKLSRSDAVIIPWISGPDVWAVKFRRLTPGDDEKYIQLAGMKQASALYGDKRPDLPFVFVEGEFKALLGWQQAGDLTNFVTVGSATNHVPERYTARLNLADRLILIRDNDPAGETNADKNTLGLPAHRIVVTVPQDLGAAKAIDDYHILGGDVAAWIKTLLSKTTIFISNPNVSDGIRSAALNCKLDAALIVYELATVAGLRPGQPLEIADLIAANNRLDLGISESTIRRGVKQGVDYFLSKSRQESDQDHSTLKEDSNPDFERKSTRCQKRAYRPAERFTLLPAQDIRANLRRGLSWRLLERYYPLHSETLPALIPVPLIETLAAQVGDLTADEQTALIARLNEAAGLQNEVEARKRFGRYRAALKTALTRLDDPDSTPLPAGWINGAQYRAIFYHARLKAGKVSADLNYEALALETGVNPGNVKAVLDRANVKNHKPPAELTILPERANVAAAAKRAATGKGKITGFVAVRDGRPDYSERQALEDNGLQTWADELPVDVQVAALVQGRAHQEIAGDVLPAEVMIAARLARRIGRNIQDILAAHDNPMRDGQPHAADEKPQKATPPGARKRIVFTAPAPNPAWLRDLLFLAAERLHDVEIDPAGRDRLTVRDAVNLLLMDRQVTTWIERSDPERFKDEVIDYPMDAGIPHEPLSNVGNDKKGQPVGEYSPLKKDEPDKIVEPFNQMVSEKGTNIRDEKSDDPGRALYDTWASLPDRAAQDDYVTGLTVEQRGQLIDYAHLPLETRLAA